MPFTTIPSSSILVSKAVKKELMDLIKNNLDDHEIRLNALSAGSGPVVVFDQDFLNISTALDLSNVFSWKATDNCNITKGQIQIYTKDGITTGSLTLDIKKSSTLGGTYTSVFTTKPTINYATATTYQSDDGVFNAGQAVLQDEYLRFSFSSVPTGVITRVHVMVYGILS